MLAKIWSAALVGIDPIKVAVEVDVAGGLPGIVIVGLPDTAIQESRERVKAGLKNAGYSFPVRKVVVNLAPADLRKEGPIFDLPISVGVLAASEQVDLDLLDNTLFLGELSLDGSLRPVAGVLAIAAAALKMGIQNLVVPTDNVQEAAVVKGLRVYGFGHLKEVGDFLCGADLNPAALDGQAVLAKGQFIGPDLRDVKGQLVARRALEVAAAGGHNLILIGPPGSGKTMLARRLPSILPPLGFHEALEVTQVHSVAGLLKQKGSLVTTRPFRAPHHSASGPSLVGGGSYPKPGEISLSHRGVLFLDELTEFKRDVLEFLRQPLEDGHVTISRTKQSVVFPAKFTLIASTNPCPCGYFGDSVQPCSCSGRSREQYWARLSGPLMDRIDLHVQVARLKPSEITQVQTGEASEVVRSRVQAARTMAQTRFEGTALVCNADMQSAHLRQWCPLDADCQNLLEGAIRKLGLSVRASDRILKVARTVADLAGAATLQTEHLAEAIQYRTIDRVQ